MRYKGCNLFFFLVFFILFQPGYIYAQEKNIETKTININNKGLFQVDFTSPIYSQEFIQPANQAAYYVVKQLKENRSLTIQTDKTSLPATTIKVEETNGKVWHINILYKEDIDLENEAVYDFADNNAGNSKGKNNIVLGLTDEKLTLSRQTDAIPYTSSDLGFLAKTYPGIDFSIPPPAQTFNRAEEGKNNPGFNEELYSRRADLKMAFKNETVDIAIVCQNLIFNGNTAYLKLLIQNNSAAEFLTGQMLLTLLRSNNSSLTLYPSYIFPDRFPILKSKFQMSVIYAFKAFDLTNDDNLKFEISDRLQKTNLEFIIPGSVYNEARKD